MMITRRTALGYGALASIVPVPAIAQAWPAKARAGSR